MGRVSTGFSMSLDGFVAGPNDDVQHVFAWMSRGDTDLAIRIGDDDVHLKMSQESVQVYEAAIKAAGAVITGRRLFDMTDGWRGRHPLSRT